MNTSSRLIKLSLMLSLLAAPAFADTMGQREVRQQGRIERGVRSGALNHREAGRLERQEGRLNREVRRDRRGGGLGRRERRHVRHAQHHLSREIFRAKHNGR
jgi:hypothetical protein